MGVARGALLMIVIGGTCSTMLSIMAVLVVAAEWVSLAVVGVVCILVVACHL